MEFVLFKSNQFQSCRKEVGRWWTHNLTHSCTSSSEWNWHPRMSFFRSPKMRKSQGERLGCTEDVEVFPSQISEAYPSPDCQYGHGSYHAKGWFRRQHSRAFWLYGASQLPQTPWNEPHLSTLLCLPPFPMLDGHILHYAHLQSNKKQLCEPVRFHYAFLLLYVLKRVSGFHLAVPQIKHIVCLYTNFINSKGSWLVGRPRMMWKNNINHDLREIDYTWDDWKTLAEDREVWRAYVHAVMNLQVR